MPECGVDGDGAEVRHHHLRDAQTLTDAPGLDRHHLRARAEEDEERDQHEEWWAEVERVEATGDGQELAQPSRDTGAAKEAEPAC